MEETAVPQVDGHKGVTASGTMCAKRGKTAGRHRSWLVVRVRSGSEWPPWRRKKETGITEERDEYVVRLGRPDLLGMKVGAAGYGSDDIGSDEKIAKMLAGLPLLGEASEERPKDAEDFLLADVLAIEAVHPRTDEIAAEIEVVLAYRLAD